MSNLICADYLPCYTKILFFSSFFFGGGGGGVEGVCVGVGVLFRGGVVFCLLNLSTFILALDIYF